MTRLAAVFGLLAALVSADRPYRAEVEAWRSQREAALRGEDGWLSVAGLFWLKEGPNRFGSAIGWLTRWPVTREALVVHTPASRICCS